MCVCVVVCVCVCVCFFFGGVTKLCLQPNVNNIYAVLFLFYSNFSTDKSSSDVIAMEPT